jgi:8-oxo-dGTP pyrophosphatase MutT (NUDIX family)
MMAHMVEVDPAAEWWTTSEVAAHLGVMIGTVSSYRQRGQMPSPDKTLGRTHLWKPQTILDWQRARPRKADQSAADTPQQTSPDDSPSMWLTHGERTLYDSEWVRLSLIDVGLPNGDRFEHHVVTLRPASIVAVLDDPGQHVLMMWRHRFAPNVWNWELPGGLVDGDEDPATTAAREAEEETGYRPRSVEHVVTYEPIIGMVRSPHHVYVAHGAERIGEPTETTEMQRMEWIPLDDVMALISEGKILNSGTLVGVLHILAARRSAT